MEMGVAEVGEKDLEHEMAQVYARGKIGMPASFESMRELLSTLDEAMPKNAFLRKWLRGQLQKEEGQGGQRYRRNRSQGRGRRGGYRGNFGRQEGRPVRNREFELETMSEEEMADIEEDLEVSKELNPGSNMMEMAPEEDPTTDHGPCT